MRWLAVLLVAAIGLTACGGSSENSHIASVCRSSAGHAVASPVTGSIVALGHWPVLIRVDNSGDLNAGRVTLAKSDYPDWLALRTFFFTPPSFRGGFTVHVRGINGSAVVGIGTQPPGGKFTAKKGPAAETAKGWRQWPAPTWVQGPGCFLFTLSGKHVHERVVVAALK